MTSRQKIWDISMPISPETPTYPGDTPYRQRWVSRISADCLVNVGSVELSTHLGTHVDAPLHYDDQGQSAGELNLDTFIGICRVIHAIGCGPLVECSHIAHALTPCLPERVLLRTYAQVPEYWDPRLAGVAPQTVQRLADLGVKLIGIDTASIDPADSHGLDSHQVARQQGLRILENLVLDEVPEGDYELLALPLKLMQADASPVRAVLRSL